MLLTAFALQSYVIQTHIHMPAEFAHAAVAAKQTAPGHHNRLPADNDPANCPICQEFMQSGHFVTPAVQAVLPPTVAVSTIAIVDTALPFVLAQSHFWRGRAPPHV